MPVSSRHKTQKINISGPGSYASGKHDFSKPGANSENLSFRFSDSIFRLIPEVSEFSKPQRGQSLNASGKTPQTMRPLCHIIENSVSHCSAIGDTISRDAHSSAIGFRGNLCLQYPPWLGLSFDCEWPFLLRNLKLGV